MNAKKAGILTFGGCLVIVVCLESHLSLSLSDQSNCSLMFKQLQSLQEGYKAETC